MKVTIEIRDYSIPAQPCIRVHRAWCDGEKVELEIDGKKYTVIAKELVSAINKAKLNVFGI